MGRNSATPGLIIMICGVMGLFVAFIEQLSYDNGYLVNEYISTSSQMVGLQIVSIIVFLLAGCVLAAVSS